LNIAGFNENNPESLLSGLGFIMMFNKKPAVVCGGGRGKEISYHLATAEIGNADIMLTVDNRFLKNARKIDDLRVRIDNPVFWLMEVMRNE
jgi:hypothetical protein